MRALLLFAEEEVGRIEGWLRVGDGQVVARGARLDQAPPPDEGEALILLLSGAEIGLRWIEIDAASEAQALAAARIALAEHSLEPIDRLHVAIGPVHAGVRITATIAHARIAAWLDWAAAAGIDPDHIVPLPLLLAYGDGPTRLWPRPHHAVVHGHRRALTIEPGLIDILLGDEPRETIDDARFEAELPAALDLLPLDLRQGPYRRRRAWRSEAGWRRRMIRYAIAAATLLALIPVARIGRLEYDGWRLRAEAGEVAQRALALPERPLDPQAALRQRLAMMEGPGGGFVDSAAILFGAVRQTANVELGAVGFDDSGALTADVSAASPSDLAELVRRIGSGGLVVETRGGSAAGASSMRIHRP